MAWRCGEEEECWEGGSAGRDYWGRDAHSAFGIAQPGSMARDSRSGLARALARIERRCGSDLVGLFNRPGGDQGSRMGHAAAPTAKPSGTDRLCVCVASGRWLLAALRCAA